jgi:hypothetical protein
LKSADIQPARVILLVALLLRVIAGLSCINVIVPDEVFQFLDQAHRLVFGQGVVPWEYQVGLRNWAIPLALAGPMALMKLVSPNPVAGLLLIRVLMCAASLGIVWTGIGWGARFGGIRGAWIAGLFTACWPDLWLMAPHALEETLAADLLVPAVYLISTGERRHAAWAALMLGGTFALRLQLAPAVAIAGIVLCGRDPKRWLAALPVAALPVLAAGLLDWFTWGQPFRSFWLNIYLNVGLGVAAAVSRAQPAGYYVYMLGLDWLWTLPVIAVLGWRMARHLKLPGVLAIVIVLSHCFIAHKEFRYIFPAIALAVPLAGAGLAECFARQADAARPAWRPALAAGLLLGPFCNPWLYFSMLLQTHSYRLFEQVVAARIPLVSVQNWDGTFLPLDILFPSGMRLTRQTVAGGGSAGAVVATVTTAGIPVTFFRASCVPGNWLPFAAPQPDLCVWINPHPVPAAAMPFTLPFPAAALPFRVPDRLAGR